jgi:hypothetical protein
MRLNPKPRFASRRFPGVSVLNPAVFRELVARGVVVEPGGRVNRCQPRGLSHIREGWACRGA